MEIDIKRLEELRTIRKRREELARLEQVIATPLLTDFAQLDMMYAEFGAIPMRKRDNRYVIRKQFIFMAAWAFCPCTLIGARPPKRFRAELARVMGLKSPQIISEELKDLLFYYTTYQHFRAETDRKYQIVVQALLGQEESRPAEQDGD